MKRFTGEVFYSTIKGKLTARAEFYDEKQGKRRQVWRTVTTTKKDAKERVINAVEDILNEKVRNPKEQTFKEYAEYYKETHAKPAKFVEGVKTEGKKSYKIIRFDIDVLTAYFGKMKLKDIKRDHVLKYRQKRLDTPVRKIKDGKEYFAPRAVASVNHELRTFSAMVNAAYANDLIDRPVKMKDVVMTSAEEKLERIPTREEFERLLAEASKEPKRWHMVALMLLVSEIGARPIEAFNLKWSDVDLIEKSVILVSDKGRKRRVDKMFMTEKLYLELMRLPKINDYVLGGIKSAKRAWNSIKTKTGIDVDLYALRHVYATRVDALPISDTMKMRLTRHTVQKTAERYRHFSDEDFKAVAEALSSPDSDSSN
jgi:integrase